jgi:tetratricopeptide (TPR) repeat protein
VANNLCQIGDFEESIPITEQALALHQEVGDLYEEACALNSHGIALGFLRHDLEAEDAFLKAIEMGRSVFSTTAVLYPTWNLVHGHYKTLGRYEDAAILLEREIQWATSIEDEWMLGVLKYLLGRTLNEFGLHEKALNSFKDGEKILGKLTPGGQYHAESLAWMGYTQCRMGHFDQARDILQRSLEFTLELPNPYNRTWPLVFIAKLALQTKDENHLIRSLDQLVPTIDLFKDSDDQHFLEEALNTIIQIMLYQNNLESALEYSQELARLLDEEPFHPAKQDSAYTLFQVYNALDKPKEAKPYLQLAYDWITLVAENTKNESWRQSWFKNARRNKEILEIAAEWGIT